MRKKFLEPEGIRQEVGLQVLCTEPRHVLYTNGFRYNHLSTWIAANFEIDVPTPTTHPEFPLWKLGYTPHQVYDLFWPSGFQYVGNLEYVE